MPLTDFFVGTDADAARAADGVPKGLPLHQSKDVFDVPLAKLAKMLKAGKEGLEPGEPAHHGDEFEWYVGTVTKKLTSALAGLSEADVKKHGAAIAKIEELGWSEKDGRALVAALRDLAKKVDAKKRLYVRVSV